MSIESKKFVAGLMGGLLTFILGVPFMIAIYLGVLIGMETFNSRV